MEKELKQNMTRLHKVENKNMGGMEVRIESLRTTEFAPSRKGTVRSVKSKSFEEKKEMGKIEEAASGDSGDNRATLQRNLSNDFKLGT